MTEQKVTNSQKAQAFAALSALDHSNPRFKAGLSELSQEYPELTPLTATTLADGIPIDVVLRFSQLLPS